MTYNLQRKIKLKSAIYFKMSVPERKEREKKKKKNTNLKLLQIKNLKISKISKYLATS